MPELPFLQVTAADKTFPGVQALQGVDFEVLPGEVHALLGENGAGKSTLIKIITGVYAADRGEMRVQGRPVALRSTRDAQQVGISCIYQDYNLVDDLTVAENICLGQPLYRRLSGLLPCLDRRAMARRAAALLASLEIDIAPEAVVGTLAGTERKLVEVAKALYQQARLVILDEPTAALEPREAAKVLALIRRLKEQGTATVFVSHRLDEVLAIADRITVLRDGCRVGTVLRSDIDADDLVRMIVGRQLAEIFPKAAVTPKDAVLNAAGVRAWAGAPPVRLMVRQSEIVGLTGLLGAGYREVVRSVVGDRPQPGLQVEIGGVPVRPQTPRHATRHGLGLVPEDRQAEGLVPQMSVELNIALGALPAVSRWGFVCRRRVRELAALFIGRLDIRTPGPAAEVRTLSGGNQQKVLLARWFARRARILALEEPTHGVDVGAKAEIHRLLGEFVGDGGSVLLLSSELDELTHLADRIIVFRHGVPVAAFDHGEATEEVLLAHAAGLGGTDER